VNLADLLDEFNVVIDTAEGLTELRSLILGLAARGKLVPQDPNDEPASELLEKIETEKKRLYEKDEIREVLNLDDVDENEYPFQIPNNWKWTKIGTFSYLEMGQSPPSKHYNEVGEGLPFYQGKTDFGDMYPTPSTWCTEPNKIAVSGDILISVRAPVGPTNICEEESCIGRGIAAIRPIANTETNLVMYFMRAFEDRIKEDQTGSTFKAINKKNLSNFCFPLPPLAEQHRIVKKIESLFAEVDELEAKLKRQTKLDEKLQLAVNAEVQQAPDAQASKSAWNFITSNFDTLYHNPGAIDNLKKNILNEAVRGRLVSQIPDDELASELHANVDSSKIGKVELPFEIPKNWIWCFYSDVAELRHGHQFRKYDYVKNGIPVIKIGQCKPDGSLDLTNCNYIDSSRKEEFEHHLIEQGDLLMALTGGTLGKVTRVDKDYGVIVQNYRVGNFIPQSDSLTLDYLNVILESELFQGLVRKKINQNAQPNIGKSSIEQILMPIPPLKEQHRIVQRIEELFAICDRFKAQLEQRQAVNERLVKGLVGEVLEGGNK
tara:strand:- start:81747 stop:83387 length:1641 start_codon:yes stop_codon:yes gene_type:complete